MTLITPKQKATLLRAGYTNSELDKLSVAQASELMDYVVRNDWKRPTCAQIDAIAAGELNADHKAIQSGFVAARIPSSEEIEEFTKDMSPPRGYAIDEAFDGLRQAVELGKKAVLLQGQTLLRLKAHCKRGEWTELLKLLNLPRATAHRQMQLAKAEAAISPKLRKLLEEKGVRLCPTMTAEELKLIHKAAEVEKEAQREFAEDLSHGETNRLSAGDPTQSFGDVACREKRLDAFVGDKVEAFLDDKLKPEKKAKTLEMAASQPSSLPDPSAGFEDAVAEITELIVERLSRLPIEMRAEVWYGAVQRVEEGNVLSLQAEVVDAAA